MPAPSAEQFMQSEGRDIHTWEIVDHLDFAERYADFMVEYEKKEGNLNAVESWPANRKGFFGHGRFGCAGI